MAGFAVVLESEIEGIRKILKNGKLNPCTDGGYHTYVEKIKGRRGGVPVNNCTKCGKYWKRPGRLTSKLRDEFEMRLERLRDIRKQA